MKCSLTSKNTVVEFKPETKSDLFDLGAMSKSIPCTVEYMNGDPKQVNVNTNIIINCLVNHVSKKR